MEYKYKPFIISAEFDESPDYIDENRWVIGVPVELGDINAPRFNESRSTLSKAIDRALFGKNYEGNPKSLGQFTFFVCSKEFNDNPTDDYRKYANIMLIQDKYDLSKAATWLKSQIDAIGEVTEAELTREIHKIFESNDWDFDKPT